MLMSLRPQEIPPVPEETARVAHAAYPKGPICMHLRDAVGTIYADQELAALFPLRGQPAVAPWRLALVCVLQFVEGLSDRQAADAVRGRVSLGPAGVVCIMHTDTPKPGTTTE
jgi:transposase